MATDGDKQPAVTIEPAQTSAPAANEPEQTPAPAPVWMQVAVWLLRVVVGAVFVFSGWAKAVDPWGGVYKIEEYLAVWGFSLSRSLTLMGAAVLAISEFAVGVMVLCGILRRVGPWLMTVFMAVMTPLTLWIFLANPVADCGCFGDALIIGNGATLAKNVVLLCMAILLVLWNRRVAPAYIPRLQWLPLIASILYAAFLAVYGYHVQPLYDFRPYPVGKSILQTATDPRYLYRRGDEQRWFSADSLPDDKSWTYVSREEVNPATLHTLPAFFDGDGEDMTDELTADTDNGLLVLAVAEPRRHGISRCHLANALNEYINARGGEMVAVVATNHPDAWTRAVRASYPVYTADDTEIKELARGEAALVYIRQDTIRWKYALSALPPDLIPLDNIAPEGDAAVAADSGDLLRTMRPAGSAHLLAKVTGAYLAVMFIVLALSVCIVLGHIILPSKKK